MLVVDASVALKWYLKEEGRPEAMALRKRGDIIAPELIISETVNGLWKTVRRKLIPREQVDAAVRVLRKPFTDLVPLHELAESAWVIAHELDHPAYDAFYLALAEREGCAFVTADARLAGKTAGTRFAALIRTLTAPSPGTAG
jgi:predicted nucleic acid-binding protein